MVQMQSRAQRPDAQCIESYDPATMEKLGEVAQHSDADIDRAIASARVAQLQWQQVPVEARAKALLRVRDRIIDHVDELATLISRESGKPRIEALSTELFTHVYLLDYFCKHAARFLREEPLNIRFWRLLGRTSSIQRMPRGVVAVVAPWNFPFSIPGGEIAMALLAGNAVVFKPSRATCLVGEALVRMYEAADLPAGLLQVVHGSGRTLVSRPVDFISFTGSVSTGKEIMAAAAQHLTPVMLELGGKDPMIVCHDAHLESAADYAVWGAFANSGQACASIERVYVDRRIAAAFIERVVEKTAALRQGNGLDPHTDVGAMCTREQFDSVRAQVELARRQGALVRTGGEMNESLRPGLFYRPTVLTGVKQHWACMREETFGPTLPIMEFDSESDAVDLANDSDFALTASVWTSNIRRGKDLARRIVAGTVTVNEAMVTHGMAETPWGGPKATGVGRTHGKMGFLEFTEPRHVHVNRLSRIKAPWTYPYSPAGLQMFKSTCGLMRSGALNKLRGARGATTNLLTAMRND